MENNYPTGVPMDVLDDEIELPDDLTEDDRTLLDAIDEELLNEDLDELI